jgi:uncharacterized protein
MPKHPARLIIPLVIGLAALLFFGRAAAVFLTEVLWFQDIGYSDVFWSRLWTVVSIRGVTAVLAGGLLFGNLWLVARRLGPVHVRRRYGNLEISEQIPRRNVMGGIAIVALLTGLWLSDVKFGGDLALSGLTWLNRAPWRIADPLFRRDLSFYVFALPFYFQIVDYLLLICFWSLLLCILGYALVGSIRWKTNRLQIDDRPRVHIAVLVALAVAILGARYWLSRYGVLFQGTGFDDGVGFTDVHARLPAQRALALLSFAVSAAVIYGARKRNWIVPAVAAGLLALAALTLGYLYPAAIQKLRVEPDQLRHELSYIRWNMEYTRRAFGLDSIEHQPYAYRRALPESAPSLAELPIWDTEQLQTVFNTTQEGTGRYQFVDVDFDRYQTPSAKRQVAISVREFSQQGLLASNRTWQTLHLTPDYVRGVGAVVVPAGEKTGGSPVFWLHNRPPQLEVSAPAELGLTDPAVYFGETTEQYVVLNTLADTAGGSELGPRGIPIGSFGRVFALAWRFSDKNLLFSGQLTDSSRFVFRRRLEERLQALAPFILWDKDPQPVIARGRIVWLIDGYSVSANFPIARPHRIDIGTVRYMRPSVKASIDAVTGETTLYALTNGDPWLATYQAAFPTLFESITEMPAELRAHLRYPAYYLRAQAEILEKYHIDKAEAFYAGEDLWSLPRERGSEPTELFQPLYTMLSLRPSMPAEFVLTAPFTAIRRQNLSAFLIAQNDYANYGKLRLLELPRDQQVPGPNQIQALMEQDPIISQQLTLWRQRGSEVTFGHVRIVPADNSLLYVVPVYLEAQTTPVPQLQAIIVSDGIESAMASTLRDALTAVRSGGVGEATLPPATTATIPPVQVEANWASRALQLMQAADRSLRAGDFAGYGAQLRQLRELLEQASRERNPR